MLLGQYLPNNCSTAGIAPLAKQIGDLLLTSTPADEVIDVSPHVIIAGGSTIPVLQKRAGDALIAAINEKGQAKTGSRCSRAATAVRCVLLVHARQKMRRQTGGQPGTSPHERAIAIDIENHADWINVLKHHDWKWRGTDDPPHFNFKGPQDPDFGREGIRAFQKLWNMHNPNDTIAESGSYDPATQARLEKSPIEGF
jgi:hypothetical protein